MGYCMDLIYTNATLPVENIPAAVKALKHLEATGKKSGGSWQGGKQTESWFSWVATDWADTNDIVEMFNEWRYNTYWDESGNLKIEDFHGEKYGDDDQFWAALSPHMHGFVEMRGEDGEQWKWILGDKLVTSYGRMVYDDPERN